MEKEIQNALTTIQNGQLLLYPTDTVWGVGCDATNPNAVDKIYAIKKRPESKALICLVADITMLRQYVKNVPQAAIQLLKKATKPTTIIYDNPIHVAPNLIAQDHTLAIRICQTPFCQNLIQKLGVPIVSTSANISGKPTPKTFAQISPEIVKGVDYVVNLQRGNTNNSTPSSIVKITAEGQINVIRE